MCRGGSRRWCAIFSASERGPLSYVPLPLLLFLSSSGSRHMVDLPWIPGGGRRRGFVKDREARQSPFKYRGDRVGAVSYRTR